MPNFRQHTLAQLCLDNSSQSSLRVRQTTLTLGCQGNPCYSELHFSAQGNWGLSKAFWQKTFWYFFRSSFRFESLVHGSNSKSSQNPSNKMEDNIIIAQKILFQLKEKNLEKTSFCFYFFAWVVRLKKGIHQFIIFIPFFGVKCKTPPINTVVLIRDQTPR